MSPDSRMSSDCTHVLLSEQTRWTPTLGHAAVLGRQICLSHLHTQIWFHPKTHKCLKTHALQPHLVLGQLNLTDRRQLLLTVVTAALTLSIPSMASNNNNLFTSIAPFNIYMIKGALQLVSLPPIPPQGRTSTTQ